MPERKPRISIAIPVYNAGEALRTTLDSIIYQCEPEAVEIILSDDCSTDNSPSIAQEYATRLSNIRYYQNAKNLGMDRNFVAATAHATGEYIWLCGQDDVFAPEAVLSVLNKLKQKPSVDFVYVNYGQYADNQESPLTERMLDIASDIDCPIYSDFISITGIEKLPTFLPSFVIRKTLWDSVPKEEFFGTQYVQLGVFLELLPRMHLFIVATPLIRGRIPADGWQNRADRRLDIFSGNLEVIKKVYKRQPRIFPIEMFLQYERKLKTWIAEEFLKCRKQDIHISSKVKERLHLILSVKEKSLLRLAAFISNRLFTQAILKITFS